MTKSNRITNKKELSPEQRDEQLREVKGHFETNMNRHDGLGWAKVQARLEAIAEKLWSLNEMERTGGEPDVVGHDQKTGEFVFYYFFPGRAKGTSRVCLVCARVGARGG